MNNAIYNFREPKNEPVLTYAPGTDERRKISEEIDRQYNSIIEIPLIIGGKEIRTGKTGKVVMPSDHHHVLATYHMAGEKEVEMAVNAALKAKNSWMNLAWMERAAIMIRAAELLSKKYRYLLNAATMLGQGKNIYQAEIDSACETIDYLRFNSYFASMIYSEQPLSDGQAINRLEYRPLEGFVYTISPFNFTAIASNLNTSVVLMGNTTVWKPATTALLSSYYFMKILKEAGLPDGVINFVPGSGALISSVVLNNADLAGIHFTGSNATLNTLWRQVSENLELYKSYPRIVGETGGKDFIFAHNSANPVELASSIVRGAFEYQGQKCSAASRAYIPGSLWESTKNELLEMLAEAGMGSERDFNNVINAVIDEPAFDRIMSYIELARSSENARIIAGGKGDKSHGYFIEPTVIVTTDPRFRTMEDEIFGPVMTIYVYEDEKYSETLRLCDETSPYGLTGSIFSNDKYAMIEACRTLRYAAGNFYINDKPTGAMVGQQPFGGARASGTNDKAGSHLNLLRWVSPRTIKETFLPTTDFRYPFMDEKK
ncbi:MAG TPA: L-glutamate gamma-semialdehyde dehydrogenase [Bacteroidales bacterium]|nr:L-glutamate gamma-semialdehyde dehydrogenase [Bacteroidales bacterium]HPF02465.1 L-glutamate gamma-semialdehyde dehydrogenase [Bacteroidales bacterium]HPJ59989.1 L-glutamate gamma-semialdehyde dehydrogenase [Bacteroidales bacterium]HPR12912.1 L-glutamate gamma-semialdehyde dehydrogenase [Bacteroidales bacterium]HRW86657.1 L-glutamate gamma-semialdehyde dehydrogenase [Bacteroidales bacterium]